MPAGNAWNFVASTPLPSSWTDPSSLKKSAIPAGVVAWSVPPKRHQREGQRHRSHPKGQSGQVSVYTGILNIGEASGIPIIKRLLTMEQEEPSPLTIIDSPPGSACNVMESIEDADYCILVAEPTLFGAHNLSMVYDLVRLFKKTLWRGAQQMSRRRKPRREVLRRKGNQNPISYSL